MIFSKIINNKKAFHKFIELQKKSHNHIAVKNCLFNNCNRRTIESHILQKTKFLDCIAENGRVVEVRLNNYFKQSNSNPIYFKNIGVKQALALPLFCQEHDDKVFEYIEKNNIIKEDYLSALLFSYRALCAEIRKKSRNYFFYLCLYQKKYLSEYLCNDDYDYLKNCLRMDEISIDELEKLKYLIEGEILHIFTNNKFDCSMEFCFEEYKRLDVCISAITAQFPQNNYLSVEVPGCLFIHLLPFENKSLLITGFHNAYKNDDTIKQYKAWHSLNEKRFTKKVTNLITKNIETWAMSPKFFKDIKPEKMEKFQNEWNKNLMEYAISTKKIELPEFDLFE